MSVILHDMNDAELARLLLDSGVGVLPTDTLYGVVCRAADRAAVRRLYELKKREGKPGTVIASNVGQLIELGLKARYLKAVEQFWPGPVSVVIPAERLDYLHLEVGSLAVRVTDDDTLNKLLAQTGALLTSSANQPARPPAHDVAAAKNYFGTLVDFYVEGGDLSGRRPSTLIRIVDDAVEVLRPGAVKIDETSGTIINRGGTDDIR